MKSYFFVTALVLGSLPALSDSSHSYSARVPANPGMSCAQQAETMSAVLMRSMNAQPTEAPSCSETTMKDHDQIFRLRTIYIHYSVDDASHVYGRIYRANYSTDIHGGEPHGNEGIYTSYQTCVNEISARSAEYTLNTGIPVISAGCNPTDLDGQFVLQVEGFGQSKAELFYLPVPSPIAGIADAKVTSQTALVLKQAGAAVVAELESGILYYNNIELFSQTVELRLLANAQECQSQKAILDGFYSENQSAHGPSSCQSFDVLGLRFYSLVGIAVGGTNLVNSDALDGTFYSFQECMTAATQVNANTRAKHSRFDHSVALCRMTDRPVTNTYENPSYTLVNLSYE